MRAKPFVSCMRVGLILAFLLALLPTQSAFAIGSVRHVKMAGAASGECLTWATACDLQYALGTKAVAGDQIWVRQGVYRPGAARTEVFLLKDGVGVYGGFAGMETLLSQRNPALNVTVLSGDIGITADPSDNSYHVVKGPNTLTPSAVLDGFTITGGNANDPTLLGNRAGAGMYNEGSPRLRNLIFRSNTALEQGGGLLNALGSPALTSVTFDGNSTGGAGGGMLNSGGSPLLTNVAFNNNLATGATSTGGGFQNNGSGTPTLNNVSFSGNTAEFGGGMANSNGKSTLTSVRFIGNWANRGGALYNFGDLTLTSVSFKSNGADYGGGMYNNGGGISAPVLKKVTFLANVATSTGGGLYNNASGLQLTGVTFKNNSAADGGGIYSQNFTATPFTATLSKVVFNGNTADFGGGGIYNTGGTPDNNVITLTNVTFSGNRVVGAGVGGGGGIYNSNTVHLSRVTFNGNSATEFGGGMLNDSGGSATLTNVTFAANSSNSGGGLFNNGASATLTNVTFSRNLAVAYGGGLENMRSTLDLKNVTFNGNSASSGGGIYNYGSNPSLNNVTVSGNAASTNGDGMANVLGSHPVVRNTIFWANGTEEVYNFDTSVVDLTYSVLKGACPASVTCTNVFHTNPLLAPLGNNGGFTKTMALQLGSSAIDKGNLCEPKDQRGVLRPQGPRCDIGAYEFVP